jgi:hypothetical protein
LEKLHAVSEGTLLTDLRILTKMHPQLVENAGSAARDFCMLERNILSHLKLALLLSLLSSSVLLQTRLIPGRGEEHDATGEIPLACVQFLAAIAAICAGVWEYYNGYWDFRKMKALLTADKSVLLRSQYILWI